MARLKSPSSKTKGASPTNGDAVSTTSPTSGIAERDSPRTETRKLESRKADARGNVVPINMEDEIRQRAYELAEQRGFQGGDATQDWLTAEREVLQRYCQHSA